MPVHHFTSQRQEDQALELCLRCDEDVRELFSDRALGLCASITEKRLSGHADWFTNNDLETLSALYRRTESRVVKLEVESTMRFIVYYSRDTELVRIAGEFLGRLEVPITNFSKRRILEHVA
jgi:hypothetical protein